LVITALTSIALASRLSAGLKIVMSPVPAGMPTCGQAERIAVMPAPPPEESISPVLLQAPSGERDRSGNGELARPRWKPFQTHGTYGGPKRRAP
jgi:hypothetical protein